MIHTRTGGCGAICAAILAELPEWFGIAEANAAYARDAETWPVWLAGDEEALMLLKPHEAALEVHLLAVRKNRRNNGLGRALVAAAETEARRRGLTMLTVKTLGPSDPYEPYAETRDFYRAVGFIPLEEFTEIWGPENPCLFMARPLGT